MKTKTGAEKRSLKNIMISPKRQIRMASTFALFGLTCLIVVSFLFASLAWNLVPKIIAASQAGANDGFDMSLFYPMLGFVAAICVVSTCFTFAIAIAYGHRFYGPMVPMIRQIEAMKNGEFSKRGKLRDTDELKELMEALNDLASQLESVSKKG
jgi:methyl-accepting chemotaxis protein